jgi:hypothetical protein
MEMGSHFKLCAHKNPLTPYHIWLEVSSTVNDETKAFL